VHAAVHIGSKGRECVNVELRLLSPTNSELTQLEFSVRTQYVSAWHYSSTDQSDRAIECIVCEGKRKFKEHSVAAARSTSMKWQGADRY
jgi:hypothetical protein